MMINWPAIKYWLVSEAGLSNDVLHVYGGVSIQLTICLLLGLSLRATMPLLFVAVLELVNEVSDILHAAPRIDQPFIDGMLKDFANSLSIPVLLFGLSHCRRLLT